MTKNLSDLRDKNPLDLFKAWFQEAKEHPEVPQAEAMVLSTALYHGGWHSHNQPVSSRVVLLKEIGSNSLIFYTNYQSLKARHLKYRPLSGLNFYWPALNRQIRLTGKVKKIPREESLKYWRTRPFESQISQFISRQSKPLESRHLLEQKWQEAKKQFDGKEVPCPRHWGGLAFYPHVVEFWQEKPHRLHDRLRFTKKSTLFTRKIHWTSTLLYP